MNAPLIASLTPEALAALPEHRVAMLRYAWDLFARESQKPPPGDWITWLYMAGRGAGKTRTASEWIRQRVYDGAQRIALVGRTPADVRDVMIEGDSGLLNVFPSHERPRYEPSNRRIVFHTGGVGHVYSSEQSDHLRGPQHDTAWCDELATFKARDAWDNLQMGLRLRSPRQIVTTTPRPVSALRELVGNPHTVLTRDTSYANRANRAPAVFAQVIQMYEGTARGQQEIMGMLLDSLPGALWTRDMIRYRETPPTTRRCIGVDPSLGDGETSDDATYEASDAIQQGEIIDNQTGFGDADCMARNGFIGSLDECRRHIAQEHPQGTARVLPVLKDDPNPPPPEPLRQDPKPPAKPKPPATDDDDQWETLTDWRR